MKKTKTPDLGPDLYWDGIGAERCVTCRQVVRMKGGAPVTPILTSDVEALACLLSAWYMNEQPVYSELVQRLERAVGRTVAQMKADQ